MTWKRRRTLAISGRLSGFWFQQSSVSFQIAGTSPRRSQPGGLGGRPPFDTSSTTCTLTDSGNGTFPVNASTMTIAKEYMSEFMVGLIPGPPGVVGTSSGADQRTEPPLEAVELRTEYISSAIEESPKSARHGVPSVLIKMLYYRGSSDRDGGKEREIIRTPFKSP